jgi:poly(3-hydroxyalkanoate) synthetase
MQQQFKNSTILYADDCIKLHKHVTQGTGKVVLLIPPHAGRHGNIAQNMLDALAAEGLRVYWYELLPATMQTCTMSVYGLVQKIKLCMDMVLNDTHVDFVDLLGICQGGWLSAIYTALYPETVSRLALFASPINLKTGTDNGIEKYCKTASMAWHRMVVDIHGGYQPGYMQWLAFALANPIPVFCTRYQKRLIYMMNDDKVALAKLDRDDAWYDYFIDLHGTWFLEAMEHHFIGNKLYEGTWDLGNGIIPKLSNIACPISVYAGADDDITHPEQARGVLDKVSSKDKRFAIFEGAGHTKVFAGGKCIRQFIDDFYPG